MSQTRQYELVYVVSPEKDEDGVADLRARVAEIVGGAGGQIEKTDNWGRRRLAYPIAHHNEGTYVLELINGPGELVRELDRRMRVMDEVLRHLVVRVDDDLRKVQRVRERRQMRHQRRRVGRGSETDVKPTVDAEASEPAVEQAEVKG